MSKKKHISLILAIMMVLQLIVPQVPLQAKSGTVDVQVSEGQKIGKRSEVFEFKNKEKARPTWFTMGTQSLFGARNVGLTKSEKVKIETTATGLDEGEKAFNWEAFGQNKKFQAWVEVAYKGEVDDKGEPIRHKVSEDFDINKVGTIDTTITVEASKTVDNYYIVTQYDTEPDSFKINAVFHKTTIVSDKGEKSIAFKLEVQQIVSTKITYNLIDEYGKAIDLTDTKEEKPADTDLKGIGKIGDNILFDLKNDGTENLWQKEGAKENQSFDEWDLMDSSLTLSLSKNEIKSNNIDYKLTSTYDVINGGTVTIKRQKDVVTPKDPHNPGEIPEGYARINLVADETGNGSKGTFTKGDTTDTTRVVDVRAEKPYTTAQAEIEKQGKPFPLTSEKKVDTGKTFDKWTPELSTLGTAVDKATKTLNATYKTSKEEIIPYLPGEEEPTKDKHGDPIPTDYVKVTFKSESEIKGKVKIGDKEGATVLAKVKPGIDLSQKPEIKTLPEEHYGFTKWDPALTKAAADQIYTAHFVKSGEEIGKNDPIPEGWYRVTVSQDADSIQAGTVPTKYYPVEPNGKLAESKFPSITNAAKDGYKDPAWYVGSDKVEKPYEVVINSSIDFVARATELDSHKITKDNGLKPVDIIAYKGDEIGEEFWKKGVKLEKANEDLQKLLDAAKVTDATTPARKTDTAGEKVGTLKVTFSDGSTIDVQDQKLIVKETEVKISFDKETNDDANAPRAKEEVVKGKISAEDESTVVDGATIVIKALKTGENVEDKPENYVVIGRGLANEDGSFVVGTRRPLIAGEKLTITVTLPGVDKASTPVEKQVKLNPDELNKILPVGDKLYDNLKNKHGVSKAKLDALDKAVKAGYKLVPQAADADKQMEQKPKTGQDGVPVTDKGQESLDNAAQAIKDAIKAITDNSAPVVTGPAFKEIFKGEDLNLETGIDVKDPDSTQAESDIEKQDGKDFSYKVYTTNSENKKVEVKGDALNNLNKTPGTYEVVYMAKDKSAAEGTFTMTLVVKDIVYTKIAVTSDPTKTNYLVKDKDTKATVDYTGTVVTLTKNNGDTETATYDKATGKFKIGEKAIEELTIAPKEVTVAGSPAVVTATYTAGNTTLTAKAGKAIIVQIDSDGNGKADESEKFDINYATSFEIVSKPELKYTVNSSKETATLDLNNLIVKVTDTTNNVKYYTWNDIKGEEKINVTITKTGESEQAVTVSKKAETKLTPKLKDTTQEGKFVENHNGAELKVVVDLVKVDENGKVVYKTDSTGTKTTELERETDTNKTTKSAGKLSVLVDKDKNGTNDLEEQTEKPFITSAKNVPDKENNNTPKTVVNGHAKPGVKIEIKAVGDNGEPTGKVLGTVAEVGKDGTYEVTLAPKQDAGTKLVAIATEGEKKPSTSDPKTVIDDMDEDGNDDSKQGFNINKATKIEFVDQPNLTYLVKEKTTEVTFDGKDADKKEILVRISYKEGEKTLSNVYKLSELNTKEFEGIVEITPAIGTTDKKELDKAESTDPNAIKEHKLVGKNLVVTLKKVLDVENAKEEDKRDKTAITNATATSANTFAIEIDADGNGKADKDEKTPAPTAKALNVGKEPKVTTITGKTEPNAKVVAMVGNVKVGETTADNKGDYKIEATKTGKDDGGALDKDTKVNVTAQVGVKKESDPTEAIVKEDKDGDGTPDNEQGFDIKKAAKIEMVSDPNKMDYLVTTQTGTVKFDATGMLVRVTDKAGKEKLYTAEELAKDTTNFTVAPANGADLTIEANHDKKVKVTLKNAPADMTTKEVETSRALSVKLDANNNGTPDDQEVFDITKATKVEIIKNPDKMNYSVKEKAGKTPFDAKGVIIRLTDASGKTATYNYDDIIKEENKGKFTLSPADKEEIGLKPDGSVNTIPFTVTVTGAKKQPSITAKENITVILDKDGNGVDDRTEDTPVPDVIARNIGKDPKKTTVEIETKPNAKVTIEYTDKDGQLKKIENLTAGEDGKLTQEITPALKAGTEVKVTVQDGEKKPTDKTVKVFEDINDDKKPDTQTERPAAIASNKGTNNGATPTFTTIEGTTEKGAVITVTVKVNGEEKPVTVENLNVKDDGTYTLEAKYKGNPLENGAEILVYAENAPKTKSKPQTTTVFNDFNNDGKPDGGKVDLKDVKDIQVISPKKTSYTQGDKLDPTGLKVVVRDNKGGIEIFEYDQKTGGFIDKNGKPETAIKATVNGDAIATVKVENGKTTVETLPLTKEKHDGKTIDVKVGDKNGSTEKVLEVKQLQTPTPTIVFAANQNTVGSDGATATQTPKDKTTVKFTVVNKPTTVYVKYTDNGAAKEESFEIKENDDATKTVALQVKLPVGAEVQVLAKDADKALSEAAKANVVRDSNNDGTDDEKQKAATPTDVKALNQNKTEPNQDPKLNDPKETTTVTGKATPGAKIKIYDKDGTEITPQEPVVADSSTGEFKAEVKKQAKDDKVKVIAIEDDKQFPSDPAEATVGIDADNDSNVDLEQSEKPKLDSVRDGENTITGTAKPGAEVKIKITPKPTEGNQNPTPIEKTVIAGPDGTFTVKVKDPLKNGDTIVATATEKDKAESDPVTATVGVDKSKLIKAIDDGEDALDPNKDGKNNGTPADKALEKAIEEGKKVKDNPNASQKDVEEKTRAINDAIDAKKTYDDNIDKLKKAVKEADELISDKDAHASKPQDIRTELENDKKAGEDILKDLTKKQVDPKDDKKDSATVIKEKLDKLLDTLAKYKSPQIDINILTPTSGEWDLVVTSTVVGAEIKIYFRSKVIGEGTIGSNGVANITLNTSLNKGNQITVEASKEGYLSRFSTISVN